MPPLWYMHKVYGRALPLDYKWKDKVKG